MTNFNEKNTLNYFLSYQSLSPLTYFLSWSNTCDNFEVKIARQKTIICDKKNNSCNSKNNIVYKNVFQNIQSQYEKCTKLSKIFLFQLIK